MGTVRGRLAPSPTGLLHLGNAWAFLWAWLACRSQQGTLVLRLEDIDPARSRAEYGTALCEDLHWLGLDWDEGPDCGGAYAPYVQSARTVQYTLALHRLSKARLVYPCYCTRKELRTLAGAPHVGDAGAPYPGTCRMVSAEQKRCFEAEGRRACLRFLCPEKPFSFSDGVYGDQEMTLEACGGDFALQRSDGVIAYQLAVAVDDGSMGITQVVRGEDLLLSTPRQLALLDLLGFARPEYSHVPLLCDEEGERLAKRHQSLTLRALREQGVSPRKLIGYLAWKAGLREQVTMLTPQELRASFQMSSLVPLGRRVLLERSCEALMNFMKE